MCVLGVPRECAETRTKPARNYMCAANNRKSLPEKLKIYTTDAAALQCSSFRYLGLGAMSPTRNDFVFNNTLP